MLLLRGFAGGGAGFGVGGDVAVGVHPTDGAIAFLEDAVAFFQFRLHVLDEFVFVELLFGRALGFFDELRGRVLVGVPTG